MKKLKQANREQLNQEYYQTAATVGDIERQIKYLRAQKANLLSNMGVLMKRIQAMPLSAEAQAEVDKAVEAQEQEAADEPANQPA